MRAKEPSTLSKAVGEASKVAAESTFNGDRTRLTVGPGQT